MSEKKASLGRRVKTSLSLVVLLVLIAALAGCDMLNVRFDPYGNEKPELYSNIVEDGDLDGKALDQRILNALYPEGFTETLASEAELAGADGAASARNYFRPSKYVWESERKPADVYAGGDKSVVREPEAGYLEPQTTQDPSELGRFFTIEPVDGTDSYKIVFTIERNPDLSSLDRVESIYYVAADDWTPYSKSDLSEEAEGNWETERIYYRNGMIGDKLLIETWEGDEAKGSFIAPDYGPFHPDELEMGLNAIFSIDIHDKDILYGNGKNDLDYYFQRFWNGNPQRDQGSYSSFTRTLVFPEGTEDFTTAEAADEALSEQNNYYTEVGISTYPAVLNIPEGTPGKVKAGLTYYRRVSPDTERLYMVNAQSIYEDKSGNFLMKDVKTLENYRDPDPDLYIYRHRQLYYDQETGELIYREMVRRYYANSPRALREGGIDGYVEDLETRMAYKDGSWEGLLRIESEETGGQRIFLNAFLKRGVLSYGFSFNHVDYSIDPDEDGTIAFDLPGGGSFTGEVLGSGLLSGIYTAADGEEIEINL